MSDTFRRPNLWHLTSSTPIAVIGTIALLADSLALFEFSEKHEALAATFIISTAISLVGGLITYHRIGKRQLPPISACHYFFPFIASEADTITENDRRIIDRTDAAQYVLSAIDNNALQYVVISGTSGVGKSTLLQSSVRLNLSNRFVHVSEYGYRNIIEKMRLVRNPNKEDENFEAKVTDLKNEFSAFGKAGDFEKLNTAIREFITALESPFALHKKLVIAFDQAERLLAQITDTKIKNPKEAERQSVALSLFLEALRSNERISLVFSVRCERLSELVAFLLPNSNPVSVVEPRRVVVLILNGIDFDKHKAAYNDLEANFATFDEEANFDYIQRALLLDTPSRSNTFILQLTGYMAEHFAQTEHKPDPDIRDFLRGRNPRGNIALEKYFEFMMDGYALRTSDENARFAISTVLFSIASENKATGQPISSEQIARLGHLPFEDVDDCVRYLKVTGAISGNGSYRLVHDQLTDYILNCDALVMRLDHREAVKLLSAKWNPTDTLEPPQKTHRILDIMAAVRNLSMTPPRLLFVQALLLFMMLFCGLRLFWPAPFYRFFEWMNINAALEYLLPGVINKFEYHWYFYLPIIVVQVLWVSFMYYLDRGYFQYALRKHSIAQSLSSWIAPFGGFFGCWFIFAPALFLVPVIAGGLSLAALFLYHAFNEEVRGAARNNCIDLAIKTGAIMGMVVGLTPILYWFLAKNGEAGAGLRELYIIWFVSLGFVFYWFAMQNRLGSQQGWSALLAMFDRAKISSPAS